MPRTLEQIDEALLQIEEFVGEPDQYAGYGSTLEEALVRYSDEVYYDVNAGFFPNTLVVGYLGQVAPEHRLSMERLDVIPYTNFSGENEPAFVTMMKYPSTYLGRYRNWTTEVVASADLAAKLVEMQGRFSIEYNTFFDLQNAYAQLVEGMIYYIVEQGIETFYQFTAGTINVVYGVLIALSDLPNTLLEYTPGNSKFSIVMNAGLTSSYQSADQLSLTFVDGVVPAPYDTLIETNSRSLFIVSYLPFVPPFNTNYLTYALLSADIANLVEDTVYVTYDELTGDVQYYKLIDAALVQIYPEDNIYSDVYHYTVSENDGSFIAWEKIAHTYPIIKVLNDSVNTLHTSLWLKDYMYKLYYISETGLGNGFIIYSHDQSSIQEQINNITTWYQNVGNGIKIILDQEYGGTMMPQYTLFPNVANEPQSALYAAGLRSEGAMISKHFNDNGLTNEEGDEQNPPVYNARVSVLDAVFDVSQIREFVYPNSDNYNDLELWTPISKKNFEAEIDNKMEVKLDEKIVAAELTPENYETTNDVELPNGTLYLQLQVTE